MADNQSTQPPHTTPGHHDDTTFIEVFKQLVIAFVLAMTFRGFVVEGFVIPTGSMAPTLLGAHVSLHSSQTGYTWTADAGNLNTRELVDPMLRRPIGELIPSQTSPRAGDRILVLKCLYPFIQPRRFDAIVFKNPNDPNSEAGNYIKRLIGLPSEETWLVDGDVFARPDGEPDFSVQRKPEHIQRALWQPVDHSDYLARDPQGIFPPLRPRWVGLHWQTEQRRVYRCDTAEPTELLWNAADKAITDWGAYNMLTQGRHAGEEPVSDVRLACAVTPDEAGLQMGFELRAREHLFDFQITAHEARVRYRPINAGEDEWTDVRSAPLRGLRPGRVTNVEFWHVDQQLSIFVEGRRIVQLAYEWSPIDRLRYATGLLRESDPNRLTAITPNLPQLRMTFSGSPVSLQRVRIDRDIHYRAPIYGRDSRGDHPPHPYYAHLTVPNSPGFGTSAAKIARLGPDHYYMLGDNSSNSLDSRLWGNPHPLIAAQFDPAPFVVHRDLLIGKAWLVYFPAPMPLREGGKAFIPNFGNLRFIR